MYVSWQACTPAMWEAIGLAAKDDLKKKNKEKHEKARKYIKVQISNGLKVKVWAELETRWGPQAPKVPFLAPHSRDNVCNIGPWGSTRKDSILCTSDCMTWPFTVTSFQTWRKSKLNKREKNSSKEQRKEKFSPDTFQRTLPCVTSTGQPKLYFLNVFLSPHFLVHVPSGVLSATVRK